MSRLQSIARRKHSKTPAEQLKLLTVAFTENGVKVIGSPCSPQQEKMLSCFRDKYPFWRNYAHPLLNHGGRGYLQVDASGFIIRRLAVLQPGRHRPKYFFYFGKYRGQAISEVARHDPDYINWLLSQDLKLTLREYLTKALEQGERA